MCDVGRKHREHHPLSSGHLPASLEPADHFYEIISNAQERFLISMSEVTISSFVLPHRISQSLECCYILQINFPGKKTALSFPKLHCYAMFYLGIYSRKHLLYPQYSLALLFYE